MPIRRTDGAKRLWPSAGAEGRRDPAGRPTDAEAYAAVVRSFFDRLAPSWEAEHGPGSSRAACFDAVVGWLTALCRSLNAPRVLDLGCATGAHLRRLAPVVRAGVGIDLSPEMIQRARAALAGRPAYRHLAFEVGDALALDPAALGRFDLVMFLGALEHMLDQERVLARAGSLLAPDGRLVVVTPHRHHPVLLYDRLRPRRVTRLLPRDRHLTVGALRRLAVEAGLDLREVTHLVCGSRMSQTATT